MKNIKLFILAVGLPTFVSAQSYEQVNLIEDINGVAFGDGSPTGQDFDIGDGCILTVSWDGAFLPGRPNGSTNLFNHTESGQFGNIHFDIADATNFLVISQGIHAATESGILTTNGGAWNVTETGSNNFGVGVSSLSGQNTSMLDYAGTSGGLQGTLQFEAETLAATSWTYAYNGNGAAHDSFQVFVDQPCHAPEPTSAALLGLAGLGFISRRKRA